MAKCHPAASIIIVDLTLQPASPLWVGQGEALSVENADAALLTQFFNVEYPSITIRHTGFLKGSVLAF
ncbi:MAG: hypothetical protein I8H86_10130 [Sphingomonadaceae bacterium]|nr:hypothetical protein [Sphingomonadaceae bacterium]MBH1997978.1 hypothetical protein [Sphingomonadaceae bacterium]